MQYVSRPLDNLPMLPALSHLIFRLSRRRGVWPRNPSAAAICLLTKQNLRSLESSPLRPAPRKTSTMSAVIPASSEIRLKPFPHKDPVEHGLYGIARAVSTGWATNTEISHSLLSEPLTLSWF